MQRAADQATYDRQELLDWLLDILASYLWQVPAKVTTPEMPRLSRLPPSDGTLNMETKSGNKKVKR